MPLWDPPSQKGDMASFVEHSCMARLIDPEHTTINVQFIQNAYERLSLAKLIKGVISRLGESQNWHQTPSLTARGKPQIWWGKCIEPKGSNIMCSSASYILLQAEEMATWKDICTTCLPELTIVKNWEKDSPQRLDQFFSILNNEQILIINIQCLPLPCSIAKIPSSYMLLASQGVIGSTQSVHDTVGRRAWQDNRYASSGRPIHLDPAIFWETLL